MVQMLHQRTQALLLAALTLVAPAHGAWDNFVVKSLNISAAQSIAFYKAHGGLLEDSHPVYGFEASDGSLIFCGKGLESELNTNPEGFVVKFSASGDYVWGWRSNVANAKDAANACLQLPNGGDVIVVGFRSVGAVLKRSITKLSLATGAEAWTATDFGDSAANHGAWEGIELTAAGDFAYACGYTGKPDTDEMSFRSYGNSYGTAVVIKLPISSLTSTTPPTSASATWTQDWATRGSAKVVRPLPSGDVAVLLTTDGAQATMTAVAMLTSSGGTTWGPLDVGLTHGEGTEMQVSATHIFLTGHNDCDSTPSPLCGKLTKLDASDGGIVFSKGYASCGVPNECGTNFIKNECWGLALAADGGAILSCGTGIENCVGMSGQMLADCQSGLPLTADLRPGAVPRAASVWQSFIVRTDADGNVLWQRADQYRGDGDAALGQPGWEPISSASEFVAKCADGGLLFVNDEASGIGILKLNADGAPGASPSPPSPPLPPPETDGSEDSTPDGSEDSTPASEGLGTGAIVGIAAGGTISGGLIIALVVYAAKGGLSSSGTNAAAAKTAMPAGFTSTIA